MSTPITNPSTRPSPEEQHSEQSRSMKIMVITNVAAGAFVGAAIGTAFGPIGILAGAVIGATVAIFAQLAFAALSPKDPISQEKIEKSLSTLEGSSKDSLDTDDWTELYDETNQAVQKLADKTIDTEGN